MRDKCFDRWEERQIPLKNGARTGEVMFSFVLLHNPRVNGRVGQPTTREEKVNAAEIEQMKSTDKRKHERWQGEKYTVYRLSQNKPQTNQHE